jgi:hypothetical protein
MPELDDRTDDAEAVEAAKHEVLLRRARAVERVLGVLLGAGIIALTLAVTAWAALVALFAPDPGYVEPTTAAQWLRVIDGATGALLQASAALAVVLLATCLTAVIGAARGRSGWTVLGVVCSVVLVLGLVGTGVAGGQVRTLTLRAIASVGETTAFAPPRPSTPPPLPPIVVDDARDEMLRMLQATADAAVAPVMTGDGAPLVIADSLLAASACDEGGSRLTAAIDVTTGDNAGSLTAILAAWDTAGYLPDRAMQEDIRYSTTLPVERMSIRDTSTIDGMLHLTVTGTCAAPAG